MSTLLLIGFVAGFLAIFLIALLCRPARKDDTERTTVRRIGRPTTEDAEIGYESAHVFEDTQAFAYTGADNPPGEKLSPSDVAVSTR